MPMTLRVLVQEETVYEGDAIPVPRAGESIERGGETLPVDSVTWDFRGGGLVLVTLSVGERPYTY
jgi:hypothetical protein